MSEADVQVEVLQAQLRDAESMLAGANEREQTQLVALQAARITISKLEDKIRELDFQLANAKRSIDGYQRNYGKALGEIRRLTRINVGKSKKR